MSSASYRGFSDKEAHELLTSLKLVFAKASDAEVYLFLRQVCSKVLDMDYLPAVFDPRYPAERPAMARELHRIMDDQAHHEAYARNRHYQDGERDKLYGKKVVACLEIAKQLPEFSMELAIHNLRYAGGR
jgi:hypothetical protein